MNLDVTDTMVRIAMDAIRNSHVLYSKIIAGACVLASDGTLYSGCTIDHPVSELSMPAEVVAVAKAVADGKRDFDALAIVADIDGFYAPDEETCQFLSEFEVAEVILGNLDGKIKSMPFEEVVPYRRRLRD